MTTTDRLKQMEQDQARLKQELGVLYEERREIDRQIQDRESDIADLTQQIAELKQ